MIHIRELTPEDAPAIGQIESMFHSRAVADGVEGHRRYLTEALVAGVNLSLGVFDDDRLVGYLLCYGFEPSAFADLEGEALYIEDVAILPKFRRTLPQLIVRLASQTREYFPGAAVEAHSAQSIFQSVRKHAALYDRVGFRLARHATTGEKVGDEARYLFRWEPATNGHARAGDLGHLLQRPAEEGVELDGRRYEVMVVRDERDWQALEPRWDELLLATAEHTVFQSYAYQRLWWRHFGGDSELFIVLLLRDGTLQGIAPMQIQAVKYYGRYCRRLGFIGSRWEVDRPTFLFPQEPETLARVLVSFLTGLGDRWDICELHEQLTGSATLRTLRDAFRSAGCLVGQSRDSDCAYLAIRGTWQQFLASKSQTFRKNLKTAARRLRALGQVEYQTYEAAPEALEQLATYRDIEARSWKSGEGVGVSRNADYFDFYRELAERFAGTGGFALRILSVSGKPVAATFGLAYDGLFYSLQIAHDREFSRCSPGTYLEALEMEECFARGYREYEFLGGFLNNKSRWTSTFRYTTQLHVYRRTPFFVGLYLLLFRIKPWVKELIRPYMKSWRRPDPDRSDDRE